MAAAKKPERGEVMGKTFRIDWIDLSRRSAQGYIIYELQYCKAKYISACGKMYYKYKFWQVIYLCMQN